MEKEQKVEVKECSYSFTCWPDPQDDKAKHSPKTRWYVITGLGKYGYLCVECCRNRGLYLKEIAKCVW